MFLTIFSFYRNMFENWEYYAVTEAIIEGGVLSLWIVLEATK